jgi:hypothetical protein
MESIEWNVQISKAFPFNADASEIEAHSIQWDLMALLGIEEAEVLNPRSTECLQLQFSKVSIA